MQLRQLTFDMGRRIGKRPIASRLFCAVERALPLHRLARSRHAVAFCHPRPSYSPHVLVVSTKPFPSLTHNRMSDIDKAAILWEMIELAATVTADHRANWRMVINGGARQEVGQAHGHLIHDSADGTGDSIAMVDPDEHFGSWEQLFSWAKLANSVPDNGYSVTFRLMDSGKVTASFSESKTS